jgi:asparagine synthase (glutamine-hydrolysing)
VGDCHATLQLRQAAMTAVAAILHRDGAPASEAQLQSLLDAIAYRGPEGVHLEASGSAAMGLRELCVLPEDQGVSWPVRDRQRRAGIVFDGRLDNREELLEQLAERRELRRQPDARLALEAYLQWGSDSFARLLGEFAFIIHEPQSQALIAVRDPMGCRRLCYTQVGATVVIASEEQALLAHPQVEARVNERHVAGYLAVGGQVAGETYFAGIYDLLQGHWIRIDARGVVSHQYWRLPRTKEYWKLEPPELQRLFREKLFAAVKVRLRGQPPPAVLLSGGLDSSSLIAAAAELARDAAHKPVAVSWVFERLGECDESRYERETCSLLGVRHIPVVCDDFWPLHDRQRYTHHAVNEINLDFFGARWASFDRIRDEGMRVVLSGSGGDELFVARNYWLHDLFASGRIRDAGAALRQRLQSLPPAQWPRDPSLRRLLPFNGIRRKRTLDREWLTDTAKRLLPAEPRSDLLTGRRWGFDRFESCISPWKARDISTAHADAQRWSLEVVEPYRDQRLVEFALNLPAFYGYDHIRRLERPLQRDAMRGLLPAAVTDRPGKTSFSALFYHGIDKGAHRQLVEILTKPHAAWPRYVDKAWLLRGLEEPRQRAPAYGRVLWGCLTLELWLQALKLGSDAHAASPPCRHGEGAGSAEAP